MIQVPIFFCLLFIAMLLEHLSLLKIQYYRLIVFDSIACLFLLRQEQVLLQMLQEVFSMLLLSQFLLGLVKAEIRVGLRLEIHPIILLLLVWQTFHACL